MAESQRGLEVVDRLAVGVERAGEVAGIAVGQRRLAVAPRRALVGCDPCEAPQVEGPGWHRPQRLGGPSVEQPAPGEADPLHDRIAHCGMGDAVGRLGPVGCHALADDPPRHQLLEGGDGLVLRPPAGAAERRRHPPRGPGSRRRPAPARRPRRRARSAPPAAPGRRPAARPPTAAPRAPPPRTGEALRLDRQGGRVQRAAGGRHQLGDRRVVQPGQAHDDGVAHALERSDRERVRARRGPRGARREAAAASGRPAGERGSRAPPASRCPPTGGRRRR